MLPEDESIPDRGPETPNEWGIMVIISLTFAVLIGAELAKDFSVAKLSVPFFLISWAVLLVIHEFGHALTAGFLGWRVDLVCIGTGKVRFRKQIFGMPVEFRTIPISGFAQPRPTNLVAPQLKQSLIYAAGPGVELIPVAIIGFVIGPTDLLQRSNEIGMIATQSFCVAAIFGAGFNLIPFPHQTRDGVAWSDGLGMIMSWRIPTSEFEKRIRED